MTVRFGVFGAGGVLDDRLKAGHSDVVVRDVVFCFGSAAPGAQLTTSTKGTARIERGPGEILASLVSEPPGPVRGWWGNRQTARAETKGQQG